MQVMTLLIGSWTVGLILAILALGVFVSFRIFAFPDITADGSLTLGAAVAAALIAKGYSPWAATAAAMRRRRACGRDDGRHCTRGSRSTDCSPASSSPPRSTRSTSTSWGEATSRCSTPARSAPTWWRPSTKVSGPVETVRLLGREVRFRDAVNLAAVGVLVAVIAGLLRMLSGDEPWHRDAGDRRQPADDPGPGRRRRPDDHARADDVQRAGGAFGRDPGTIPGLRRHPDGNRHDRTGAWRA